jgi:16S rRNA (guanine966-N2)-methyltransferase
MPMVRRLERKPDFCQIPVKVCKETEAAEGPFAPVNSLAFHVCQTIGVILAHPMRISGGAARGIPLQTPKGDAVRPATDGLRQAVFSSLAARVPGSLFADLFAGSGSYGLEALSRGAVGGVWVEKNAKATACLRKNLAAVCKSLGRNAPEADSSAFSVLEADALTAPLNLAGEAPDLVFIDPPYELITDLAPKLFAHLTSVLAAKPDALVVFEMPGELALAPDGWICIKRIGKGSRQPTGCFFRRE